METNTTNVTNDKNALAVAGLVLGIGSVILSFVFVWLGLVLGIVGIILSAKGRKIPAKKGLATAGLVLSIIGTALSGLLVVCAICAVGVVGCAAMSA